LKDSIAPLIFLGFIVLSGVIHDFGSTFQDKIYGLIQFIVGALFFIFRKKFVKQIVERRRSRGSLEGTGVDRFLSFAVPMGFMIGGISLLFGWMHLNHG
jgi:hypothetical protein